MVINEKVGSNLRKRRFWQPQCRRPGFCWETDWHGLMSIAGWIFFVEIMGDAPSLHGLRNLKAVTNCRADMGGWMILVQKEQGQERDSMAS